MSYSAEVLADTPEAFYRLGESSGTTMADSSGNGRDGVYEGSPTLGAAGLLVSDADTAVTFDGTDDRGRVAAASWMDATSFTIEAVIKPSSIAGVRTIAGRYDSFASGLFTNSSWQLRIENGNLQLYVFAGGTPIKIEVGGIVAGTTYHVAATRDGSTGASVLYVDGTSVATGTLAGMNASTRDLCLGRTTPATGGEPFAGEIDEVAFYSSVLSSARIADHYTAAVTAGDPAGALAASLTVPAVSLAGVYDGPLLGSLAATLPAPSVAVAGSYTGLGVEATGTLTASLPVPTLSLAGSSYARNGYGLVLDSESTVDAEAPLPATPSDSGAPALVLHVITPTVPTPVLVDGRPS